MNKVIVMSFVTCVMLSCSVCFADTTTNSTQPTLKLREGVLSFDNVAKNTVSQNVQTASEVASQKQDSAKTTATDIKNSTNQNIQNTSDTVSKKTTSVGKMLDEKPEKIIVAAPEKKDNETK